MKEYGIWGLGYDENADITDFEMEYISDATYEKACEIFTKICKMNNKEFFKDYPDDIYAVCLQVEEIVSEDEETKIVTMKWIYR